MYYHFRHDRLSPRLLQAIGLIVVNWVHIENEIIEICRLFKTDLSEKSQLTNSFDGRAEFIKNEFYNLFNNEYCECTEEICIFKKYYEELKYINILRDDICHGLPSFRVRKNGEKIDCIIVVSANKGLRERTYTIKQLENLPKKFGELLWKTGQIHAGIYEALIAASSDRALWDNRGGEYQRLTKANRKTLISLLSG